MAIPISEPISDSELAVLELRVHGVNNTTAAALLDLKPEEVEQITGDKLGSFWRPTAQARLARTAADQGFVPPHIVREAYSWGGMVRTTPDLGSAGASSTIPAVLARIVYALILPFSIANAVQWTRKLDTATAWTWRSSAGRIWAALTAAASRVFSLVLTLLFAATAATVFLDLGAAQCAADPTRCEPIAALLQPIAGWSAGQQLALLALGPIVAVVVLWVLSEVSRLRYDVLPGMKAEGVALSAGVAPRPALARRGFWSNRTTRDLAKAHVSAAILLTVLLALAQGQGLWPPSGDGGAATVIVTQAAWIGLAVAAATAAVTPTGSLGAEEGLNKKLVHLLANVVLFAAAAVSAAGLLLLAVAPPASDSYSAASTAGETVLWLIAVGGGIAISGILWRWFQGMGRTAWWSFGPFVLMTVALALALAISAILTVTLGDLVATKADAAEEAGAAAPTALVVPEIYLAVGSTILLAVVVAAVLIALVLLIPKSVRSRAAMWSQATNGDELGVPAGGVLPPSASALFTRINDKRKFAARLHLVEPVVGIAAVLLAVGVTLGCWWAIAAAEADIELWEAASIFGMDEATSERAIQVFLDIAVPLLGWIGVALIALLVSGAATAGQRPLGIVWDIACYLPRTGHPFGPPCYAERAVPEIAGRLYGWLDGRPERRAVLAAHSMGAVLSVSALGLLASQTDTRRVLPQVSLLTFGVQLRTYFGRMLPDLLGPDILGTSPSRPPVMLRLDPWGWDFKAQQRVRKGDEVDKRPLDSMTGTLLAGQHVRWINLWRLSDYLGFTVTSTARSALFSTRDHGRRWRWTQTNLVDRYAGELDTSGYMVEVGTHGEYYRVAAYGEALDDLAPPPDDPEAPVPEPPAPTEPVEPAEPREPPPGAGGDGDS